MRRGSRPVPVVVALLLRRWLVAAVAGVAALALLTAVLPRTLAGPQEAQRDARGQTLVVMTANLRFGRADADAIVRLVREHDVDVLSLQELTPDALRRLDAAGAARLLPARSVRPDMRWSGLGLLARAPLRAVAPRPGSSKAQLEAVLSTSAAIRCVWSPSTRFRRSRRVEHARLAHCAAQSAGRDSQRAPRLLARRLQRDARPPRTAPSPRPRLRRRRRCDGRRTATDVANDRRTAADHDRPRAVRPPIKVRRTSVHTIPGSDHRRDRRDSRPRRTTVRLPPVLDGVEKIGEPLGRVRGTDLAHGSDYRMCPPSHQVRVVDPQRPRAARPSAIGRFGRRSRPLTSVQRLWQRSRQAPT